MREGLQMTYEKRLLDALLGYQKSGKFQSQSRMQQTVDAYVDMYIPSASGARALGVGVLHIYA